MRSALDRRPVPHQRALCCSRADEPLIAGRRVGRRLGRWGEGNSARPRLGDCIAVGVGWHVVDIVHIGSGDVVVVGNAEPIARGS